MTSFEDCFLEQGENGEIYLTLRPDTTISTTYEPVDGILLDFDKSGKLIGIEILDDKVQYRGNNYLRKKK